MATDWCAVAPLDYRDIQLDVELPFELAPNILFDRSPDWFEEETLAESMSSHQLRDLQNAEFALLYRFKANSLDDADPQWQGENTRTVHDRALETLQLVNTALWLAKPSSLNYPIIVTFDESVSPVSWRNCSVLWGRLAAHKEYMNHKLKSSDFKLASSLLKRIVGVKRPSAVWVALYSLWTALIDKTWEVRYLFLWIALEGLFGPDDSREMTFRLSQRLALFLGTNPVESLRLFNDAKRGYGWRSKVTHGIRLDKLKSETADTILFEAEICVRKALVKILQDDDLVDAFTSRRREEYLDGLPFSNKWRHDFA